MSATKCLLPVKGGWALLKSSRLDFNNVMRLHSYGSGGGIACAGIAWRDRFTVLAIFLAAATGTNGCNSTAICFTASEVPCG